MIAKISRYLRRWNLRRRGATVASDVQSECEFTKGDVSRLECGPGCYFRSGSMLILGTTEKGPGHLVLKPNVFINHFAIIDCHEHIEIGEKVMIGPFAYIADFQHDAYMIEGSTALPGSDSSAPVNIGANAWIGAHAVILKGVTIGEGAVIGAGAVVTCDVPPMQIAVGVPARVISARSAKS